ncbi:unnamed protein product [Rotaria sordida]|uniref:Uncharacterized protein n=1 Tax=Rotaria sordida TaxID=392033 RepID=A0A814A175_9BILA|nr:unnamed protein product [Rotaria sordida]CAF1137015.1 unnamed protein product [Rotaria sordida]
MDVELTNESEELIQTLGNRIEEIERTLYDDEDFCNKDIDATYQAGLNYLKNFQEKFHEKLNELKIKLEQIREENLQISKQNKKQFDDELEIINQLFSSGKHQEAVEKFQDYEKRFEQRKTLINNIPKLFIKNIDIQQYFSFDKPLSISQTSSNDKNRNSLDHIKPLMKPEHYTQKSIESDYTKSEDDDNNEKDINKSSSVIQPKRFDTQRSLSNYNSINKESKSPISPATARLMRFSTRLPPSPSPSSKSLPVTEHDTVTPSLLHSNSLNSGRNIPNYTQVRPIPSSPNINSSLNQRQISTVKSSKGELTLTYVAHYEHERNTSILMTCNTDYIILCRNRSNQLFSWYLSAIDRSNLQEQRLDWHDHLINSIGFINKNHLYIFSEHYFIIYSLESNSQTHSLILPNDNNNHNSELNDQKYCIGTIYDKYIYYIYLNIKHEWILSIFEFETKNHLYDYNLTENFPKVKRFIHICVNNKNICFLVEMDGSQYAVVFCSYNNHLIKSLKEQISLFYAGNPLTICSIYISYIQKYIFFINDPSAKIIHIITNEKYLQSYSIIAHAFYYINESQELILTSNDGIYSIDIHEQMKFFSKFH